MSLRKGEGLVEAIVEEVVTGRPRYRSANGDTSPPSFVDGQFENGDYQWVLIVLIHPP